MILPAIECKVEKQLWFSSGRGVFWISQIFSRICSAVRYLLARICLLHFAFWVNTKRDTCNDLASYWVWSRFGILLVVVFSARSSQFLKYFPAFAPPFDTCSAEFARSLAPSHDGGSTMVTTTPDPELEYEEGGKSGFFLGWFKVAKVAVIVLLR